MGAEISVAGSDSLTPVIDAINDLCPIRVTREINTEGQPKTASEALLSFMKKKRLSDVRFTFENSPERIEAHQLCLRSRSPVFDSMFRGLGSVSSMVELKVEDVEPELFRKFLEFIYTDKLDVTPVEALHLHQLGQKYKVQPLIENCEALLRERIPVENAVEIYETADKYGILGVRKEAADTIVRSLPLLLQDPQLLTAKEATLLELLARDDLKVREVDLFRFVLRWGQEAAVDNDHLPQVLARLLSQLRFSNMTPKEFTTVVLPTKLIPAEEVVDIYAYFNGDQSTRTALISTFKFSTYNRCGKLDEVLEFYETDSTDKDKERWKPFWCEGQSPLRESISFQVRGVTGVSRTCSYYSNQSHSKLQLKSIQVQWPSLVSNTVGNRFKVFVFMKAWPGGDFMSVFHSTVKDYNVGCVTEIPVDPPLEIDETEYCIAVYDELCYQKPCASMYRYSSDASPCGRYPKSNVFGAWLTNVEIRNVQRNNCPKAKCDSSDYLDIHVIRGIHLELAHANGTLAALMKTKTMNFGT